MAEQSTSTPPRPPSSTDEFVVLKRLNLLQTKSRRISLDHVQGKLVNSTMEGTVRKEIPFTDVVDATRNRLRVVVTFGHGQREYRLEFRTENEAETFVRKLLHGANRTMDPTGPNANKVAPSSSESASSTRAPVLSAEEVGQSNIPTVAPNFLRMLQKAFELSKHSIGFCELAPSLTTLGFPTLAAEVAPLLLDCYATPEEKEKLFKEVCRQYTLEDSGDADKCQYRQLNWAARADDPELEHWASFVGLLMITAAHACASDTTSKLLAQVPPSMQPKGTERSVFRGLVMPPECAKMYKQGNTFFWQSFVSTSSDAKVSLGFATRAATETLKPFLFHITVRSAAGVPTVELREVSQYPEEAELLLMPYTRFRVTKAPTTDDAGVTHIYMEAIAAPFSKEPIVATVWVDPNGFKSGSNLELARKALLSSLPSCETFHRGKTQSIAGSASALALFTDHEAALTWMCEQTKRVPAVVFKILVSGRASPAVFNGYFKVCPGTPCELLVYCADVAKWKAHWATSPQVEITADEKRVRSFLQHSAYTTCLAAAS